jgi:hypothetical protein
MSRQESKVSHNQNTGQGAGETPAPVSRRAFLMKPAYNEPYSDYTLTRLDGMTRTISLR